MTSLLLSDPCKKMVKKLVWKLIDIFPNQVLKFLNFITELEKNNCRLYKKHRKKLKGAL